MTYLGLLLKYVNVKSLQRFLTGLTIVIYKVYFYLIFAVS